MYSSGETANHAATSFFFYTSPLCKFCIALAAAPPRICVCAGFVLMTTPVIRRRCRAAGVNTAEVHYFDCCACLYLAPGCVCSQHFSSFFSGTLQKQLQNCACTLSHKHTYAEFEPEFIVTVTSIKRKMLSLQPPCDQLSSLNQGQDQCKSRRATNTSVSPNDPVQRDLWPPWPRHEASPSASRTDEQKLAPCVSCLKAQGLRHFANFGLPQNLDEILSSLGT